MLKYLVSFLATAFFAVVLVVLLYFKYKKIDKKLFGLYGEHKLTLIVYIVLRVLVAFVLIRCIFNREYYNALLCFISLILMILPGLFEKTFKINFPSGLEVIILCFIFAAEILGEIESFYTIHYGWDTVLHTLSGFLSCAVGFSLFELINHHRPDRLNLSPFYLAIVAFCFANTIGVLWEFGEFSVDKWLLFDAQKDFVVEQFSSIYFDPEGLNNPVALENITNTTITLEDGTEYVVEGGYLDIGIIDTIKDLFVNAIGAFIFSIFGYLYVKSKGKGKIAKGLIPTIKESDI